MPITESALTIGNRYATSIAKEIALLEKRIAQYKNGEEFGFTFHNLASPCEMLEKYYGDKLRAAGFTFLMGKIDNLGKFAREIHKIIEEGYSPRLCDINEFYHEANSLLPIFFFL